MEFTIKTPKVQVWRIEGEFANVPHKHEDQFQVTIPLHGLCFFTHENVVYDLAGGECLVQYPQDRHSFQLGADSGVMIVQVDRSAMGRLGAGGEIEPAFRQRIEPARALEGFRSWCGGMLAAESIGALAEEELESSILFFLYRHLQGSHSAPGGLAPIWSQVASSDRMARVLAHVRERYAEPLRVDELAAIARQSRYHFIRSFRAYTGSSPYQYVLRLRVEDAKRRLRDTDLTATEIGLEAGFASLSQFHRAFVKAVGMTPEQYRALTNRRR